MIDRFMYQCGLSDSIATIETYDKLAIIESCMDALGSGNGEDRIITMATSYTHSMFNEILDNVRDTLLKLVQKVLSALNNYFMNHVGLLTKYEDVVMDRLRMIKIPVKHETYEYPELKDYPHSIKSGDSVEKEIIQLQTYIKSDNATSNKVISKVNKMLQQFSKTVTDFTADPYELKNSVKDAVIKKVRGSKIVTTITSDTLHDYIMNISTYKNDKNTIMKLRKSVLDDYEALKRVYADVTKNPQEIIRSKLERIVDPDKEAFIANEYSRYADIHIEMMRLFNGFITIYQTAFDTCLSELKNKVLDNRNTIVSIMTVSGVFAALNAKEGNIRIPYNNAKNII